MSTLPWLAIALVLLAFALADDLPAPSVRRAFLFAGLALVGLAGVAVGMAEAASPSPLLTASGPLAFLLIHQGLRWVFRRWKGDEPVLTTAGSAGSGGERFAFQKGVERRVTWMDYLYTFALGTGMLVACAPAIAELVERFG